MFELVGSIVSRVTMRFGSAGDVLSWRVHVGVAAVPLVVMNTSPLLCPTQITSGLPAATAMALIGCAKPLTRSWTLIAAHVGPVVDVSAVVASLVRQSDRPPASSRRELFGSRMNGAMKLALAARVLVLEHTSVIEYGAALHVEPLTP